MTRRMWLWSVSSVVAGGLAVAVAQARPRPIGARNAVFDVLVERVGQEP